MWKRRLVSILMLCPLLFVAKAQLTVMPNNSGSSLAQLLAGTGVTVSNVTLHCPVGGAASFTSTATNLGIDSGIMLTTGRAVNAIGPNNSPNAGTDNLAGGDPVLDSITGASTYDGCELEFDVTPVGNTLVFKYVFGSEEYPEFVHQGYNDVFVFLITGPLGNPVYNNRNIALLPGTSTPVSIDNVNDINNSQYYVDNTGNQNIQYDGMTTPLFATLNVVPCSTYHFKLAIADVGDGVYDSGVFLEANSLSSQGTNIVASVPTAGANTAYEGCVNGKFTITLPKPATSTTTLSYTISGTATNGVDYVTLPGSVVIPAGDSVAIITLQPLADALNEGTETVIISLTNPCNGALLTSATMIISDVPQVTATAIPYGVCYGQQVQLHATGGTAYTWSSAAPLSSTNIASPTSVPLATSTYIVSATLGTCSGSASVSVPVSHMSLSATATPDTMVCPGSNVALNAQVAGGKAPYAYHWSPTAHVLNPNAGGTTATPYSNTSYVVSVTDSIGCSITTSVDVDVIYVPAVTLGPNQHFCPGQGPATLTPGWLWDSYHWNTGSVTDTIHAANGSYWVTVTSSNFSGCNIVSDTVHIVYLPVIHPTLADTGMCPGQTITLRIDAGFTSPVWSNGSNNASIQLATNDTVFYSALDGNGCPVNSDTVTVTISQLPVVNATVTPDTICPGSTATLRSGAPAGLQYLWLPDMHTGINDVVSAPGTYIVRVMQGYCMRYDTVHVSQFAHAPIRLNNDTIVCPDNVVSISVQGRYTAYLWSNTDTAATIMVNVAGQYSARVQDDQCYFPTDTFTLSNFGVVDPVAYRDTNVCTGQPVPLTGQAGYSNYLWSNAQPGPAITVTTPGRYSFAAIDANGCDTHSDTVTVTDRPYPVPAVIATPNVICIGQGYTVLNAGSDASIIYTWQPGNIMADTIHVTQPGTYYVTANKSGCISFDSISVASAVAPVLSLPAHVTTCCEAVTLDPAGGQNYSYRWSDNSSAATLALSTTHNVSEVYEVTATNTYGCTATAQADVFIKCIEPVVTATPDTIILPDSSLLHVSTSYATNFNYAWGPATGLNNVTGASIYASPPQMTTYTVVVTDTASNCTDTAQITVYIIFPDKVAVPDAFTPNGDGKNDVFYPVLLSAESQHVTEFRIFNRWGQLVHNNTNAWDGKLNGKDQPSGTFVYYLVVRIPDKDDPSTMKDVKFEGAVTLLR